MNISVCIAAYNGERFIHEQIASILPQLGPDDELIVSDDTSEDRTVEIVKRFNDPRIVLLEGNFRSHVRNFEHALKHARGTYIFLADQDDIWEPNKVERMLEALETCDLVLSDATMIDEEGNRIFDSFYRFNRSRPGLLKNFHKNSYLGCCMAFRRPLLDHALPFPAHINMHDWWIGMLAELSFRRCFIEDKLVLYRRHGDAVTSMDGTSKNPLWKKLLFRYHLFLALAKRTLLHR